MRTAVLLGTILAAGVSCGEDEKVRCGEGTHLQDGTCVPDGTDSDTDTDTDTDTGTDTGTGTGTGTDECPPPRTDCDGACVDLDTDEQNCGRCGNACAPGAQCATDPRNVPTGGVRCTCDPFGVPAGCAEGEKCGIVLSLQGEAPMLGCFPEGDRQVGESCDFVRDVPDMHDDCVEGAFCYEGDLGRRVCEKLCWEAGGCSDVQPSYCSFFGDIFGPEGPDDRIGRCRPDSGCSACLQTGCEGEEGCYVVGDGTNYIHVCVGFVQYEEGGVRYDGTPGDPCEYVNNCLPGYTCRTYDGEALCRFFCGEECEGGGDSDSDTDTAAPVECEGGATCVEYGDMGVGVCVE